MIVCIEDNKDIREMLEYSLKTIGWQVTGFEKSIDFFNSNIKPELILLDIMLGDENGETVLKKIRQQSNVPVIMLTAKTSELDKVNFLNLGADDYITKPFGIMELNARINALLRRTKKTEKGILTFNEFKIDEKNYTVTKNNQEINLTKKEFLMFVHLVTNKNIVITRENLLQIAWGYEYIGESRSLDVHMASLRTKLGIDNIKTIRGIGYKLEDK